MRFIKIIFVSFLFFYPCVLLAESGKWVWFAGFEAHSGTHPSPCQAVNSGTKEQAKACTCANFSYDLGLGGKTMDSCTLANEHYDPTVRRLFVGTDVAYHTNEQPPVYGVTHGGIQGLLLGEKPESCSGNITSSQPVKMSRGEKYYHFTDSYLAGGFPLVWDRSYRVDVRKYLDGKNLAIGNWYFPLLDMHLYLTDYQTAQIILDDGGGALNFTKPTGVWSSEDNGFGIYNTLTDIAGGGWKLVRSNGLTYEFNDNGFVTKVTTQGGLSHTLSYGFSNDALTFVRMNDEASGKFFDITLSSSRVTSVTDSDNRVTQYVWDADDRLNAVIYPNETVQVFEYDSDVQPQTIPKPVGSSKLITGIFEVSSAEYADSIDPVDPVPLSETKRYSKVTFDDLGRVTMSSLWNGSGLTQKHTFSYNWQNWSSYITDPTTTMTTYGDLNNFSTAYKFFASSSVAGAAISRNWRLVAVNGQEGASNVTGCAATSAATTYDNSGYIYTTTDGDGTVGIKRDERDTKGRAHAVQTGLNVTNGVFTATNDSQKVVTSFDDIHGGLPAKKEYYGHTAGTYNKYRTEDFSYDSKNNLLAHDVTDEIKHTLKRTTNYSNTYCGATSALQTQAVTDPMGHTTTYQYNCSGGDKGQLASVTDAANHMTTYSGYNSFGLPGTVTDTGNSVTTMLGYDFRGRLTSSNTAGAATTISYWPTNGLVKRITLPDGSWLEYTYNSAHQLINVSNHLSENIALAPSILNGKWTNAVTSKGGAETLIQRRVFDALGRVWKQKNAAGVDKKIFSYDANDNLQTIVALGDGSTSPPTTYDAGNHVTYREFDKQNRIKCSMETAPTAPATCMGSVASTRYNYDDQGNIKTVTDANNHTTTYTYNGFGELETQVSPDTGTTTYTYYASGNLHTKTKGTAGEQQVITYSWDALNRLTGIDYNPGTAQDVTYNYDEAGHGAGIGRLTSVVDGAGNTTSYQYDDLGNVTLKTETGAITLVTEYHYSTAGVLEWIKYPGGQKVTVGSAGGQIDSLKDNDATPAFISNITHQPFGGITGWKTETPLIDLYIRNFDADGRVSQWGIGASSQGTSRMHALQYDAYGNISAVLNLADANQNEAYEYDAQNHLSKVTAEYGRMTYSYDAVGNRLGKLFERKDPAAQVWEEFYTEVYGVSSTSNRLNIITRKHGTDTLRTRSFGYDSHDIYQQMHSCITRSTAPHCLPHRHDRQRQWHGANRHQQF